MRAKEITSTSWILYDKNDVKLGLLISNDNQFSLFTKDKIIRYTSEDLQKTFGKIRWEERIVVESKKITIAKLPVDNDEIFDIIEDDIPSYKKSKTGKARYVPGYWGIKFSSGYVSSFCPKLVTIEQNECIGPFKTKFEMDGEIALANRKINETILEEKE